MRLRTVPIAFVAFAFALALPSLASASVASQFRVAIGNNALFSSPTQTAQRNSYVVLQAWETERATQLKAANPNLEVLVYQNLSSMVQGTGPGGLSSSGVNSAEANTAHPEWYLTEANGNRIPEESYNWLWMADIGNPSYQQQWTANVVRLLKSGPWDGVMMDETNTTARYDVSPVSRIAKYPTDAAYQAAVGSMLAYAGPAIQAAGKLAIPNMGSWPEYPEVVKGWLPYVSGGVDEMFTKWSATPGQGYRDASGWQTQIEEIQTTEQMGKRFLAITQASASDTQAIRYGWASTLLEANGHTAFTAAANYSEEIWSSEYEVPLGEPTSAATKIAGGAWKRTFKGGLVVVNPTTTAVTVSFGGNYSGSGLTNATGATLDANSAVILTGEASKSGEKGSEGTGGTGTPEPPKQEASPPKQEASPPTKETGSPQKGSGGTSTPVGGTTSSPVTPPTPTKSGSQHQPSKGSKVKVKAHIASVRTANTRCRRGATASKRHGHSSQRGTTSCSRRTTKAIRRG